MNAAIKRQQVTVKVPKSVVVHQILTILVMEGFIYDYSQSVSSPYCYSVSLAYFEQKPVLKQIIAISKPGRKVYSSVRALRALCVKDTGMSKQLRISNSYFTKLLVSTSYGLLTATQAISKNVGGELLCKLVV